MDSVLTNKTVDQKKADAADRLSTIKAHWPYAAKLRWCIENGYNVDVINRNFLRGSVTNLVVAEKLIAVIEEYMRTNGIAA